MQHYTKKKETYPYNKQRQQNFVISGPPPSSKPPVEPNLKKFCHDFAGTNASSPLAVASALCTRASPYQDAYWYLTGSSANPICCPILPKRLRNNFYNSDTSKQHIEPQHTTRRETCRSQLVETPHDGVKKKNSMCAALGQQNLCTLFPSAT